MPGSTPGMTSDGTAEPPDSVISGHRLRRQRGITGFTMGWRIDFYAISLGTKGAINSLLSRINSLLFSLPAGNSYWRNALFFSLLAGNSAPRSNRGNLNVGWKHLFRAVALERLEPNLRGRRLCPQAPTTAAAFIFGAAAPDWASARYGRASRLAAHRPLTRRRARVQTRPPREPCRASRRPADATRRDLALRRALDRRM